MDYYQMNPNFFQVYFPSLNSNRLRIPIPFLKHIIHETSPTFFLIGPSEKVWCVNLIQNDDGYFFEQGWAVFVRDHCMGTGDFFVFIYEGNLQFSVQIFDPSGGEKESAFHATRRQDCTDSIRDKGKKIGCNESVKVLDASSCKSYQGLSKSKINMAANVTHANIKSGTLISQRRDVTKEEKKRTIEAAEAFESNNPFTIIVMRPSYVYYGFSLSIPSSFRNFYLPDVGQEIILRDPSGRAWPVSYVVYYDRYSRGTFSAGWGAFAYDNNIEADDVCIFELIKENEMQVHIFRVVREISPLIKHSKIRRED